MNFQFLRGKPKRPLTSRFEQSSTERVIHKRKKIRKLNFHSRIAPRPILGFNFCPRFISHTFYGCVFSVSLLSHRLSRCKNFYRRVIPPKREGRRNLRRMIKQSVSIAENVIFRQQPGSRKLHRVLSAVFTLLHICCKLQTAHSSSVRLFFRRTIYPAKSCSSVSKVSTHLECTYVRSEQSVDVKASITK